MQKAVQDKKRQNTAQSKMPFKVKSSAKSKTAKSKITTNPKALKAKSGTEQKTKKAKISIKHKATQSEKRQKHKAGKRIFASAKTPAHLQAKTLAFFHLPATKAKDLQQDFSKRFTAYRLQKVEIVRKQKYFPEKGQKMRLF